MKKVLLALGAVLMLATVSCNKNKEPEPGTPGGGGNGGGNQPEEVTGDGVFNPQQKISTIVVDGATTAEWAWENGKLQLIASADEYGNLIESNMFEYTNGRLSTMTAYLEGVPVVVDYSYTGDKLASVDASAGPMQVLSIAFERNANDKISHLTMSVNEYILSMLSDLIGDGGFPNLFSQARPGKFSVSDAAFAADLAWQGDNVSQVVFSAQIDGSVSLSEIRQMVNLDSLAGGYAAMLSYLADTTAIPLSIALADTTGYTYDSRNNPFYGYLGALDFSNFSANNAVTMSNHGTATITVTLNFGIAVLPVTFPYPIASTDETYSYTYNAAGFPVTVTTGEGSVTQYNYLQE